MDNNRDGIIDDPLATAKRRGRKSLGLTDEQRRARRVEQWRQRTYDQAVFTRYQSFTALGLSFIDIYKNSPGEGSEELEKALRDYCMQLAKDEFMFIKPLPKSRP